MQAFPERNNSFLLLVLLSLVLPLGSILHAQLSVSPAQNAVCAGDTVEFTASLTNGTPPIYYSWSGPNLFSSYDETITVTTHGLYSVTAIDSNGVHYGPVCVILNLKERPTLTAVGGNIACLSVPIRLSAHSTASNAVYSWSGPGIVSGGDTSFPWINVAGEYQVTVTSLNGCTSSTNVSVTENLISSQISVLEPETLSCSRTEIQLSVSSPIPDALYEWSGPGIVSGSNLPICSVNQPGRYTVVARMRQFGFGIWGNGTIRFNSTGGTSDWFNGLLYPTNSLNIDIGNSLPGLPNLQSCYSQSVLIIDQDGIAQTAFYPDPRLIYNGHFNIHYNEPLLTMYPNDCLGVATVEVFRDNSPSQSPSDHQLHQQFVSFPQGFWANGKGKLNGIRSATLLETLTAIDAIQVGKPGRSLSIPANSAAWLHDRLPAVGAPGPLPSFGDQTLSATTGQTSPAMPTNKKGQIQNSLLGHMIALELNLRLDETLRDFQLALLTCSARTLAGGDRLIGSNDDLIDLLGPDGIAGTGDEHETFTIAESVLNALCEAGLPLTGSGLLELGNRALAGIAPAPATYEALTTSISVLNETFEGGRYCVPCE